MAASRPASARCWCWKGQPRVHRRTSSPGAAPADVQRVVHGKDLLPGAGEYTVEVIARGLLASAKLAAAARPDAGRAAGWPATTQRRGAIGCALAAPPARPPGFASAARSGRCSRRSSSRSRRSARQHRGRHRLPRVSPPSSRSQLGPLHPRLRHEPGQPRRRRVADDAAAPSPSWATAASGTTACSPACRRRCSTATTRCCVIMKNGYTSATGTQDILNTPDDEAKADNRRRADCTRAWRTEPDHRGPR